MDWEWLTKRRTGIEGLVAPSIGIITVGIGMWAWGVYRDVDPDDQIVIFARTYVVMGIIGILVPLAVMWHRKRNADHTEDPEGLHG